MKIVARGNGVFWQLDPRNGWVPLDPSLVPQAARNLEPNQIWDTDTQQVYVQEIQDGKAVHVPLAAPTQGAGGPAGPTASMPTPAGAAPAGNVDAQGRVIEIDPETAYRRSLGFGGQSYLNPWQQYLGDRYGEVQNLHRLLGNVTGLTPEAPADYNQGFTGYAQGLLKSGIGQGAGALLKSIFSMDPNQRAEKGLTFENRYDPMSGGFEAEEGQAGVGQLQGALRSQLARQLGPQAGAWFAGRLPTYMQQWRDMGLEGTTPFLEFLKTKGYGSYA